MSRLILINTLRDYFTIKGKFMTVEEYKEAEDAPYRYQIVKRTIGTWARLKNLVGELPVQEAPKPVVKSPVEKKAAAPVAKKPAEPTDG